MVIDVELGALTETSCGGKLGATEEKCDLYTHKPPFYPCFGKILGKLLAFV